MWFGFDFVRQLMSKLVVVGQVKATQPVGKPCLPWPPAPGRYSAQGRGAAGSVSAAGPPRRVTGRLNRP